MFLTSNLLWKITPNNSIIHLQIWPDIHHPIRTPSESNLQLRKRTAGLLCDIHAHMCWKTDRQMDRPVGKMTDKQTPTKQGFYFAPKIIHFDPQISILTSKFVRLAF